MTIGLRRGAFISLSMGLVIAASSFSSLAQDAAKKAPEKSAGTPVVKKKGDPSRRVPDHFGQIGLTQEQRESIYKVRKSHQEQIDTLKKQITEAESKSLNECEAVLTETQKKLLENLRTGSPKATAKATETSKSAK